MIYSRQYKKKATLSFVFSLFPDDSLLFYSGLSLFSEIYKMSVLRYNGKSLDYYDKLCYTKFDYKLLPLKSGFKDVSY